MQRDVRIDSEEGSIGRGVSRVGDGSSERECVRLEMMVDWRTMKSFGSKSDRTRRDRRSNSDESRNRLTTESLSGSERVFSSKRVGGRREGLSSSLVGTVGAGSRSRSQLELEIDTRRRERDDSLEDHGLIRVLLKHDGRVSELWEKKGRTGRVSFSSGERGRAHRK